MGRKPNENPSEGSLMKKTKKELVEIILRKDDVEIQLKNEVKTLKEIKADAESMVEIQLKNVAEHQAVIDELTSQKVEYEIDNNHLRKTIKKQFIYNVVITALFVAGVISCFVF